jgi:protein arginine kinase
MFDEMAQKASAWLTAEGDESAIVLSSRIRLARNIRGFKFPPYADKETRGNVVRFVQTALDKSKELDHGLYISSEDVTEMHRAFLIERHLISPEFMREQNVSGLYISPDEKVSIMVNEEDHIRIQSMSSGLSLIDTLNRAMRIDDDLASSLEFDYDTDFGYLTSCPTNVGTGLRASILIHLAGLVLTKEIDSVIDHINKLGLVVRGFYGEGTDVWGNLFQISNQTTLGRSEADITESLEKITRQIIEFENKSRDRLLSEARDEIADKIWRAYGILRHARVLTSEEVMNLLSAVRLGAALKILDMVSIATVNKLLILSQPAHLQKHMGVELSPGDRDVARAKLVRDTLTNLT